MGDGREGARQRADGVACLVGEAITFLQSFLLFRASAGGGDLEHRLHRFSHRGPGLVRDASFPLFDSVDTRGIELFEALFNAAKFSPIGVAPAFLVRSHDLQ